MQLEFKHLAPYAPFKLKLTASGILNPTSYLILIGVDFLGTQWVQKDEEGQKISCFTYKKSKPFLFPLSDLIYFRNRLQNLGYNVNDLSINQIILDIKNEKCGYDIMQMCFEEHIDVFGLIDKGLAFDINTLSVE